MPRPLEIRPPLTSTKNLPSGYFAETPRQAAESADTLRDGHFEKANQADRFVPDVGSLHPPPRHSRSNTLRWTC